MKRWFLERRFGAKACRAHRAGNFSNPVVLPVFRCSQNDTELVRKAGKCHSVVYCSMSMEDATRTARKKKLLLQGLKGAHEPPVDIILDRESAFATPGDGPLLQGADPFAKVEDKQVVASGVEGFQFRSVKGGEHVM